MTKTATLEFNRARRSMLASSAALLAGGALTVIGASPAVANPDAELLALCAEAEALYRRIHDLYPGGATPIADDVERTAALSPLCDEEAHLGEEIFCLEAKTLAGHRARARIVLAYHGTYEFFENDVVNVGTDGLVLAALVRDLVGEGI